MKKDRYLVFLTTINILVILKIILTPILMTINQANGALWVVDLFLFFLLVFLNIISLIFFCVKMINDKPSRINLKWYILCACIPIIYIL